MRTIVLFTAFAGLLVVAYFVWERLLQRAEFHAEQIELRALYDRWIDAGRPTGEQLMDFMKGRREDFGINTQLFILGHTNYVGKFALTNLVSRDSGLLVITTNKVILYVVSNQPVVVNFKPAPF